jgi:hypothetical protein
MQHQRISARLRQGIRAQLSPTYRHLCQRGLLVASLSAVLVGGIIALSQGTTSREGPSPAISNVPSVHLAYKAPLADCGGSEDGCH